jgi:hypothetical protein
VVDMLCSLVRERFCQNLPGRRAQRINRNDQEGMIFGIFYSTNIGISLQYVRFEAFMVPECNEVLGNQLCENGIVIQRFRDCHSHSSADIYWHASLKL